MAASSSDWPVHQLWPPPEDNRWTELDVVFFHGLQSTANDTSDAWRTTWTQRGHDDVCWPEKWLPLDLREAVRIFSVSYNAHVVTSPHGHVSEIADNLFQTLFNPRYEWHHPIVLIGHSFGGLVLKSIVVKVKTTQYFTDGWSKATYQCAERFLSSVRGVAFYAVPHAGSSKFAEYAKMFLRCNNRHHPGIMDNIQPWQRDMEQLSVEFDDIVNGNKINIYAFCEGRPTEDMGILVEFSSAQRSARKNFYKVEDANHMEVCKPPSKEHPSYGLLLQFINTCAKEGREWDQTLQAVHDLPQPMFGLERYVKRVETLVTSKESDAAPQHLGVWGMGGVGKTVLLRRLYWSPKVRGHFKGAKFIWCTVGQTPDIMALYRTFSAELGLKPELNLNPEDYKLKLHSQFGQKRVFLILDDVWHAKAFKILDLAKGRGSVTLLSSRDQSLFERASPQISQEHMTPLSKEDSWSLFCVHAFRSPSNVPSELETLARCMADECRGLPLALKVIGEAMFGEVLPEQWKLLLKRLGESRMQEMAVKDELYERLKLGYDLLSEDDGRLKDCFLHFAAFPEDYSANFNDILWHWIGEGLVPGNGGDDPKADAFSLLNKLRRRSFIESEGNVDSKVLSFKLHDVMRDLAFYILENDRGTPPAKQLYLYRAGQNLENFPQEWEVKSKARKLSLWRNKLCTLPTKFRAPDLLTLLLYANPIVSLPGSFLWSLGKLRVLDLQAGEFDSLPDELGDLKQLVYLNLSWCIKLELLPDTVEKLRLLKNLNLSHCHNLKCLPSGLVNLTLLLNLNLSECYDLKFLPSRIVSLTLLRNLNLYHCSRLKCLPSGLVGLTSLQVLNTDNCESLRWAKQSPPETARAKNLDYTNATIGVSLEEICELTFLTELYIDAVDNSVMQLPPNVSALTNLQILKLNLENIETLPAEMPYYFIRLQKLHLWTLSVKSLPRTFTCCGAFPALIKFEIICCMSFVEFPEVDEGALPKLKTLRFAENWKLETLPLSLGNLTSLRKLILDECEDALIDSCMTNCEMSSIWRAFNIRCFGSKEMFWNSHFPHVGKKMRYV